MKKASKDAIIGSPSGIEATAVGGGILMNMLGNCGQESMEI